ncbi:cytochrome P450 [Coprinopsis marcescibilis]|uniref:Cytochrome P450 n=1 Tax=Coprinopsis marcescibilis TaxID=230819 RepID=A0A5C3KXF2_COPMA|nr:cytochrome P450 [Coprinopsis marcescibilis]
MINPYQVALTLVTVGLVWFVRRRSRAKPRLPLPPGPPGLPLIGNLKDMPTNMEWEKYHEWCKEYNTDILHLRVATTSFIVVDTAEIANDLLEKRSSLYSGRARLPMVNELMGWTFNFGFMDYGNYWRKHRRIFHHSFHPTAARQFHPHISRATKKMLNRFLEDPSDMMEILRHLAAETVLKIAYGIEIQAKNDPYVRVAEAAVHTLLAAAVPGAYLVDAIPLLKYIPAWVPGAGFRTEAKEWRVLANKMVEDPYRAVKAAIANGTAIASFVSVSLQKMEEGTDEAYQEDVIKSTAGTMYTAGADTTVSAISSCLLALTKHPEIMRKAQKELDSVVQAGNLPSFDDEPSLPYITAIVKETLRWRDVVPLAIPHMLSVDDEYRGYHLPAGSIIIPNAWAMLHDEKVYPEPFRFNPDRFMKDGKLDFKTQRDPNHACFGFGRRICPARYMAFSAVWLAIASILYVFELEKVKDEDGNDIEPLEEYFSKLVILVKPFQYTIKPRSKEKADLIKKSVLASEGFN